MNVAPAMSRCDCSFRLAELIFVLQPDKKNAATKIEDNKKNFIFVW
jgi:hypothetical protein